MNNKSCGCSKGMPVRPVARMPKGMMPKAACETCNAKDWSCGEERCNMIKNKQMEGCGRREACASCSPKDCCDRRNQPCGRMPEECPCVRRMPKSCCNMGMSEERPCERKMPKTCCNMEMSQERPCACGKDCQEDYMDVICKKYGMPKDKKYRKCNNGCELEFGEAVDVLPIGMGYVPFQEWDCNVSNACQGLYDGTIFPELVKPFVCTYCYEEGSCR